MGEGRKGDGGHPALASAFARNPLEFGPVWPPGALGTVSFFRLGLTQRRVAQRSDNSAEKTEEVEIYSAAIPYSWFAIGGLTSFFNARIPG